MCSDSVRLMTQRVQMTFRYRFHPTAEQAEQLGRTFGCVRLVYNMALEARIRALQDGRPLTYGETSALLTVWTKKDEFSFLRDVSCVPLQQALRHLQAAVGNLLAGRARRPRFTSRRRSRASAEFTRSAFTYCDGRLTLAKMRSPMRIVWSRPLPEGAERHERSHRRRRVKAQRALSRKLPGSANHAKARLRPARVHAHVADRRRDHLHKLTTRLVRENQAVVIEDLNVGGMVRNHRLARAIADAAWRETRSTLEYKCAWYGRELIVVDRWFPSSKRCSSCGAVRQDMPLDVRKWTCGCGAEHDRDVNAARNILAVGLAERRNACGADIRPQRETSFRAGDRRRSRNLPSPEEKPSLAW